MRRDMLPAEVWTRLPISRIEDPSDAVRGAGLDSTQMSSGHLSGSLVFSNSDGIEYSGLIDGGQRRAHRIDRWT
ncbi:hypothetical protein AOQ73_29850 [Bradyrhizobium pachyrhizi]|nr:hypothetical protein AOQ73_29850 [Bradyrhizobium pachyrhizi]